MRFEDYQGFGRSSISGAIHELKSLNLIDEWSDVYLKENGDKISAADKTAIEEAVSAVKTALEGTDTSAIKEKSDALMQASLKLGEAMYKAQGAAQGATGAEQGASTGAEQPKQDEKVVDADFEEVK